MSPRASAPSRTQVLRELAPGVRTHSPSPVPRGQRCPAGTWRFVGSDGAWTSYQGSPHSLAGTSLDPSFVPTATGPVRQPRHSGGGSVSPLQAGLTSSLCLEEACAHQKSWFSASLYLFWEKPWLGSGSCCPIPALPRGRGRPPGCLARSYHASRLS